MRGLSTSLEPRCSWPLSLRTDQAKVNNNEKETIAFSESQLVTLEGFHGDNPEKYPKSILKYPETF